MKYVVFDVGGTGQAVELVRCAFDSRANQVGALQSYLHWHRAQTGGKA